MAIMSIDDANILLKQPRIKIGWFRHRIQELIVPELCRKCKKYGHNRKECKGELKKLGGCLRCGNREHKAKGCTNQPKYYVCKVDGHRADSMACPKYKEAVGKKKTESGVPINGVEATTSEPK